MPKSRKATERPTKHDRQGARLLALFLDSGDVPDYITDGAARELWAAEEATGIEVVKLTADGIDVAALARLIAATRHGLKVREKRPETVTAERLAVLLEAPETPPVLRELLQHVAVTVDCFAAEPIPGTPDYAFGFGEGRSVTAARIRRKLPAMLRKVGHWHMRDDQPKELYDPTAGGGER
jgi:hypothetical protein